MTVFSILALGFFLGMRHATDSDHVIAVATYDKPTRRFWYFGKRSATEGHVKEMIDRD